MKNEEKDQKIKDFRTHTIIGIAMEVHREMRPGFLEAVTLNVEKGKELFTEITIWNLYKYFE